MAKHNKKRNVGLLHEQLVRHASQMTVEGNRKKADEAIKILIETFSEGTELKREFQLFSALAHSKVDCSDIARRIVEESRRACADHDPHKLDKEKSALIRKINHQIDRPDFYDQRVENYRIFSTVQALLNEWRGKSSLSPDERIKYELVLEQHLAKNCDSDSLERKPDANPLVFNLMIEKFNKKYEGKLSDQQSQLLKSRLIGDDEDVIKKSNLIKLEAKSLVQSFFKECDNNVLNEKKESLLQKVENYDPNATDESISKALMLADLIKELEE